MRRGRLRSQLGERCVSARFTSTPSNMYAETRVSWPTLKPGRGDYRFPVVTEREIASAYGLGEIDLAILVMLVLSSSRNLGRRWLGKCPGKWGPGLLPGGDDSLVSIPTVHTQKFRAARAAGIGLDSPGPKKRKRVKIGRIYGRTDLSNCLSIPDIALSVTSRYSTIQN